LGAQSEPSAELLRLLREQGAEVNLIGDALSPRDIMTANYEGYKLALEI
jgi:histidinol phosphatase-like PHP family hydrolase